MEPKVFRSTGARVAAWAWLVFTAANLADVAIRGRDLAALIAAAVLLLGSGIAYVLGLRPRIVADDAGVRLRNPLRDVSIPWRSLRDIEAAETLRFHYAAGDGERRRVSAWAWQTSPRARARAERRSQQQLPDPIAEHVKGRMPADFVVEQVTELAAAHGGTTAGSTEPDEAGTRPSVTWSAPALAALTLPGALLAILILVAALTHGQ